MTDTTDTHLSAASPGVNMTGLPEDMQFNNGHRISLVGYSTMFVVSSVANLRVLYLLKRRYALKKAGNFLFQQILFNQETNVMTL